ncbi:alpha-L-fucosidase [Arcticibacterium luteifluviistationis]|uniref:alpha-L-fucosidase n=1 Tax=Arcticibacterium luteifluviistationis TaxID=1784714 RepID=A0A2Z4GFH1_9BACT|nr:alpha-L-fucosidase [Arcticibacterium luteifluviistationis]AWW00130.1 alpha-L-fucosidase [Arcticibacterium luteifluviistationis]
MKQLALILGFISLLSSCQETKSPPETYGVLPSERQLAWHEMETYALVHFTPTTFENKEWGYGDADPSVFNPSNFDADQIINAAKAGGLKGLILVAKHHDGFALWPTKSTEYNITKSPWKNGEGDMVKEFQMACEKAGLKFGVYCSPWDRNSEFYGTPKYLEIYRAQLKELYSNYGDLFMSWHDGANGGDGYYGGANEARKIDNTTYYDWTNTWEGITRKLQPTANIFSDIGLDVRWVGGEHGYAAETHWATFSPEANTGTVAVPGNVNTLVSSTGTRNGKYWMPAECDVPLRPGWFYHPEEDGKEKDSEALFDLYLKSVGRGAGLDLGLAPTPEGILHNNDVEILKKFGTKLSDTFRENYISGATLKASNVRGTAFGEEFLIDDDRYSYWATDDEITNASVEIELSKPANFDLIRIRENIKLGQRIDKATVEVFVNDTWEIVGEVNSIGATRLIKFDTPVESDKIRITFNAPVAICISDIGIFKIK